MVCWPHCFWACDAVAHDGRAYVVEQRATHGWNVKDRERGSSWGPLPPSKAHPNDLESPSWLHLLKA